jgi:acyl carrier protein
MSRGGMAGLSADEGLALLDLAMSRDEPLLVPARLDVTGARAQAARGAVLPALWRGLAGGPGRPAAASAAEGTGAAALRQQLAALPVAERDRMLVDLVRAHAAAVLGHTSAEEIEPGRAFSDLGFDSLTAVELRNRLHTAAGLRLPATLVFDYPTPTVLAAYLREKLAPDTESDMDSDEHKLREALASVPISRFRDAGLMEALLELVDFHDDALSSSRDEKADAIDTLDAESLVRMAFDSGGADF